MYQKAKQFWNEVFGKQTELPDKAGIMEMNSDALRTQFEAFVKGSNVLDFGCGSGWASLFMAVLAKEKGNSQFVATGIDQSQNAIDIASRTASAIGVNDNTRYIIGDESSLSEYEDGAFEGLFSSNTFDVIPTDIAANALRSISRVLRKGARVVIMLNPYADAELIEKLNMEVIEGNAYSMKGVLRCVNMTSAEWQELLSQIFEFEQYREFRFEGENENMKRRLFILKKA